MYMYHVFGITSGEEQCQDNLQTVETKQFLILEKMRNNLMNVKEF